MKKSDKKLENTLIKALTKVCEAAQNDVNGFKWLTHFANYNNFPDSLAVVCVFDTNADLLRAMRETKDHYLRNLIQENLAAAGIRFTATSQRVTFDTEQACLEEHDGKWNDRFS